MTDPKLSETVKRLTYCLNSTLRAERMTDVQRGYTHPNGPPAVSRIHPDDLRLVLDVLARAIQLLKKYQWIHHPATTVGCAYE